MFSWVARKVYPPLKTRFLLLGTFTEIRPVPNGRYMAYCHSGSKPPLLSYSSSSCTVYWRLCGPPARPFLYPLMCGVGGVHNLNCTVNVRVLYVALCNKCMLQSKGGSHTAPLWVTLLSHYNQKRVRKIVSYLLQSPDFRNKRLGHPEFKI